MNYKSNFRTIQSVLKLITDLRSKLQIVCFLESSEDILQTFFEILIDVDIIEDFQVNF